MGYARSITSRVEKEVADEPSSPLTMPALDLVLQTASSFADTHDGRHTRIAESFRTRSRLAGASQSVYQRLTDLDALTTAGCAHLTMAGRAHLTMAGVHI